MSKRVKESVAVLIRNQDLVLAIRRPADDDELPEVWGLPAGTCTQNESIRDVIERIGSEKLGVRLTPVRRLGSGTQDRPSYFLKMELWEATMSDTPAYPEWKWTPIDLFEKGAEAGSLCCDLALKTK